MATDADTGVGTGSPIVPGAPGGSVPSTYKPPVYTALSLLEYAYIMGINPIQFMSGDSTGYFPSTGCTDRWRQYPWQDEQKVSRDELAREILQAELDIAAQLGYYPGLLWREGEVINYPHYFKRAWTTVSGTNVAGYFKSVKPRYGKIVEGGERKVEYIGSATFSSGTLSLVDDDGDGFAETALIQVPTTYTTDPYRHKVYFTGMGGELEWEIRPASKKEILSTTLHVRMPVQLLFKPELLAAFPGESGFQDLDPSDTSNLVSGVDVYYETADPSQGNLFHWNESGQLQDDLEHTTQLAYLETQVSHRVKDSVSVTPALYDGTSQTFTPVSFDVAREPDYMTISYLSGDYEEDLRSGTWRMPRDLAQAIAFIATARLPRPLCVQCQNVKDKEKRLRTDLAFTAEGESGNVRFVTRDILRNPFGTRYGEVEAYRIIKSRIEDGEIAVRVAAF